MRISNQEYIMTQTTRIIFVIDTNQYAGNFEREMCAYMTGIIGDCEVGREYADMFNKDINSNPFQDLVSQQPDEGACYRPCAIWKSLNPLEYNSVAIFFEGVPTSEQIALLKERAKEFTLIQKTFTAPITIHGFRLITEITTVDETFVPV